VTTSCAGRWAVRAERHEDNLVAVERCSIPASVFADETHRHVVCGKIGACYMGQPQWRDVIAQRVVRRNRWTLPDRPLRDDTGSRCWP